MDWATLRTDFLEGKTAMMWHTTGNLTAVKEGAKFNFGVAMLPCQGASRFADRRRQLLYLQERLARATEGRA